MPEYHSRREDEKDEQKVFPVPKTQHFKTALRWPSVSPKVLAYSSRKTAA